MLNRSKFMGFSLVEMMVVISILALLTGIGVPIVQDTIQSMQIRSATESVLNGLQLAKSEALKRSAAVKFTLNPDLSWSVDCNTITATCLGNIRNNPLDKTPMAKVTITPSGNNTVVFNGFGLLHPAFAATSFTELQFSSKTAGSTARILKLIVGTGGSVRVCDPAQTSVNDPRKC